VKAHVLFAIPTLTTIHDLKLLTNLSCDHHYNLSKFQATHEYSTMWRNYKCFPKMGLFESNKMLSLSLHSSHKKFHTVRETEGTSAVELRP
jgi:hypothetical protein